MAECPARAGGKQHSLPCNNVEVGAICVRLLCVRRTRGGAQGGIRRKGRGVYKELCTPNLHPFIVGEERAGTEQFGNLPQITQPVAAKLAANLWPAAGGWAKKEEVPRPAAGR